MGWATQRGPRPRLVATSHRLDSCVIVSGFRAALDLNTYPLGPRCAEHTNMECNYNNNEIIMVGLFFLRAVQVVEV